MSAVTDPDAMAVLETAPFLRGADPSVVRRLAEAAELLTLPANEPLLEEGTPSDAVFVIVDGEVEVSKRSDERDVALSVCAPGELIGELALLQDLPRSATVRAARETRVLRIDGPEFRRLLDEPVVARHLLRVAVHRLGNTQAQLRQSEKMAALGTMAAGLTHELNNPAAALRRAAAQCGVLLPRWEALTSAVAAAGGGAALTELGAFLEERVNAPRAMDPLDRSDAEEALQQWLEEHEVEPAWELAGHLVALGVDRDEVERRLAGLPSPAAEWLAVGAALRRLVHEAGDAAERVSGIVAKVKRYSHLDEAPVQEIDLNEELERTVAVMRHKLGAEITVVRDFGQELPKVHGNTLELNQVWTNLIDNAADAMDGRGTLTLRTRLEGNAAVVEVADDGPGIPDHVRGRIFEPFVTTKAVGKGTGLGLHLVYDVVSRVHRGDITVDTGPDGTLFRVRLPVADSADR